MQPCLEVALDGEMQVQWQQPRKSRPRLAGSQWRWLSFRLFSPQQHIAPRARCPCWWDKRAANLPAQFQQPNATSSCLTSSRKQAFLAFVDGSSLSKLARAGVVTERRPPLWEERAESDAVWNFCQKTFFRRPTTTATDAYSAKPASS